MICLDPLSTWHGPHHQILVLDIFLWSHCSKRTVPTGNYSHLSDIGGQEHAAQPTSEMGISIQKGPPWATGRVRTKTEAKGIISEYLKKAKLTAKLVYQYAHGNNRPESAVPKRDRMFEEGDILDIFNFSGLKVIPLRATAKFASQRSAYDSLRIQ